MAGFDEDGGFAPWMAQPDDVDQRSSGSSGNGHRQHGKEQVLPQQRNTLHSNTNGYNMATFNGVNNNMGENGFMPSYYGTSDATRYEDHVNVKAGRVTSSLYPNNNTNGNFYFDPPNMSDYLKHQQNSGVFPRLGSNDVGHNNFEVPKGMDPSSFGVRNQGNASFPWFSNMGDQSGTQDGTDGGNMNYSGYYESNLKASASSVSLSEFAMSLWPSMNNLATAAEAVSSSGTSHGGVSVSPPQKNTTSGESSSTTRKTQLGSLSRLDSLSNVALDELEAMSTSDADRKSKPKSETTNNNNSGSEEEKVKVEGDKSSPYDAGYSIGDGGTMMPTASKPPMQNNINNNNNSAIDVAHTEEGKPTVKLPEVRNLNLNSITIILILVFDHFY